MPLKNRAKLRGAGRNAPQLVSVAKLAPPFRQAPEGRKENSPGRKPGIGLENSVEPWATEKVADKDLWPLPGLLQCYILSGGLRPRLLSLSPSGARPADLAAEFRDRN